MALILWYCEGDKHVRKTARDILIGDGLELRHHISMEFPEVTPDDLVVVLGETLKKVLEVAGHLKKGRTIGSLRGTLHDTGVMKFIVTYHPSIKEVNYELGVECDCDLQLARRYILTGTFEPTLGEYEYPDDLSQFNAEVHAKYLETGKPVEVSFDLETMGVDPFNPEKHILNLSASHTEGTAIALTFTPFTQPHKTEVGEQVTWLLNTPEVSLRGANLKFDLIWVAQKWGIECTNFKFDTLLVGSMLDENRSNSLKVHAKVYTDLGGYSDLFDSKYDKAHMELIPPEERQVYAASDADATLRVAAVEKRLLLQEPHLTRFYIKILHPAARAFEKVERCGVLIDVEKYQRLQHEMEQEQQVLEAKALSHIPRRLRIKWGDKASLSKPKLLSEFLFTQAGLNLKPRMFTEKKGEPSTSMDHFEMFGDDERAAPFVQALKEYNSVSKMLSTFVIGFLKHLRVDTRFHPTYFLANQGDRAGGTLTGRLSARDPALQTLVKHNKWAKKIRACYIAPKGMVILGPDYSQGELRVAACLANAESMIQAYIDGIDLHALSSSKVAGYTWEEFVALKATNKEKYDELRQLGKAINFGLIYGMSALGFKTYAELTYKVIMTLEEAEESRSKFFSTYPELPEWHKFYKRYARRNKQVVSPLGRVRHLPLIDSPVRAEAAKAERQAVNSPVQSALSDFAIWTFAEMEKSHGMDPVNGFCGIGMVHDQLLTYAPEAEAEYWAEVLKYTMENLPFHEVGWEPQLKFIADMSIGYDLANLQSWEKPGDFVPAT